MGIEQGYLGDAKRHLAFAATQIKVGMSPDERFQAVVCAAVGVEKLLKHVIAKVNPALIFSSPEFINVVVACHMDKVASPDRIPKKTREDANTHVITASMAIQRASMFCDGVGASALTLQELVRYRDIMVHRFSGEIDAEKCDILLWRDFYIALEQIAVCVEGGMVELIGGEHERLRQLSVDTAAVINIQARMRDMMKRHLLQWEAKSPDKPGVDQAERHTDYALEAGNGVLCVCPACGNDAVEVMEPEFDYVVDSRTRQQVAVQVGAFVSEIRCYYCDLRLSEYDEIAYAKGLMHGGGATP